MSDRNPRQFRAPTAVVAGRGARHSLPDRIRRLGLAKPAVVVDSGLLESSELVADLFARLADAGLTPCARIGIAADPTVAEAQRVATEAREKKADIIVAIGGGSAMDAAKAGAMLATNERPPLEYVGRNLFSRDPLPMIAVPTTCGTGSDVSWVAVLRDEASSRKVSIKGDGMFPRLSILDSDFLAGLPSRQVAWTGMDAMTHAIEAWLANCATPFSDVFAAASAREMFEVLPKAVQGDAQSLERAQVAATQAGFAFGNADVGAVHCLSETLGGLYKVPHGLANAALLVPVLRFYKDTVTSRLAELARLVSYRSRESDEQAARGFLEALEELCSALGIPPFSGLGISADKFAVVAEVAVTNGSNGSCPREMTSTDYAAILRGAP